MADWAHAPLSKALDIGVLVAHALWRNSGPSVPPSTLGKQSLAWRFTTANLVLLQTSELVFSLLLIYQFRFLERRMGSAKYSAFVLFATVVGWALRVYLLQSGAAKAIASGPYAFMFACFPVLLREVPACPTFKVGPFEFSDRSFYYVVGLQLAVASAASRWAAGCGLAAGTVYLLFGRRAFSIPSPIARLFGAVFLPFLDPPPVPSRRQQMLQEQQQRRQAAQATAAAAGQQAAAATGGDAAGAAGAEGLRRRGHHYEDTLLPPARGAAAGGPAQPVREEDIAQLQAICSRGRIDVIAALQRTNGNVEAAADFLLTADR